MYSVKTLLFSDAPVLKPSIIKLRNLGVLNPDRPIFILRSSRWFQGFNKIQLVVHMAQADPVSTTFTVSQYRLLVPIFLVFGHAYQRTELEIGLIALCPALAKSESPPNCDELLIPQSVLMCCHCEPSPLRYNRAATILSVTRNVQLPVHCSPT